ncbi:MAG: serine/threonine-protein kinase [Sandaracinaceae bacterium]
MSAPRFRILRALGRGGMAEVLLAERADGARVALKRVLAEHVSDPRFRRMFLDEARIASTLEHPGIVRVIETGEEDGRPFIALEWVDGRDAASWLARGRDHDLPLPEVAALHVGAEVARALHAAHEARDADGEPLGIVHRDVSPGNVMIGRGGRVQLGDFGIAKARDRLERTSVGMTKGKHAFMSPEQMLGAEIDGRADVFSLGCTLHRLLTGRSAIGGEDDAATLMAGGELELSAELSDDVRAVIAKAVAPSRVRRWPTARAMAEALDAALAARGTDGRAELRAWIERVDAAAPDVPAATEEVPTGPTEPATAPARRRSWGPAVAALVAVAVLVSAGVAAFGTGPASGTSRDAASRPPPPPVEAPVLADAGAPTIVAEAPRAEAPPPPEEEPAAVVPAPRPAPRREPRPSTPTPAPEPAGTGHLLVGGPGAVRRVVFVDGRRRDFAPITLELPAAAHLVELRDLDGQVVASQRLTVGEEHTRRSPLRWIVPAP